MKKNKKNPAVDAYIEHAERWQEEIKKLRSILLGCGFTEELKWGKPCYTYQDKNIVIIQGFKKYCALLFFKGVLLTDPDCVLFKTGANTHAGRQLRFTNTDEIENMESIIQDYLYEAIEIERSGMKVGVE